LAAQDAQAEVVLRQAVRLGPKEWRAWSALGQLLLSKAWRALAADLASDTTARPELLLAAATQKKVSAAQLEQAQNNLKEAIGCADRAVMLAPKEPQPLADRALVHSYTGLLRFVQDILKGGERDSLKGYEAMFPTNALADLDRAARLAPEDPAALAKIGLFRLLESAISLGKRGMDQLGSGQLWHSLNDRQRQALRRIFTGLEDLGHSGNPAVSASALEFLGAFQWTTMRDHAGAEKSLRRAVQLDASRDMAWDFLMAVLVDADRKEEAIAVAESRLKSKQTIRNFVAAAKACDRAGRLPQAQHHLETALKLDPTDYP
jgi:tetratricopeptide (TPR) repeat protein